MTQVWEIHRFIERDYWLKRMAENGGSLTSEQMESVLDGISDKWDDYTFKLFRDGSVQIIDNDTRRTVRPSELRGASLDFYIRTRIRFIRSILQPHGQTA
ncbi:hypothetical protein ACFQWB_12590 [Paenibacillus thermoaerophilus]|uniref:Uncharacterized protein n=1 Tax=Paenibacillus thermoaerophilus TaxID=1215385 RepID=A0ABW2V3M4_9BACL|nr:hypothetical protein [Paenibacillus thermoaerophilus]TMV17169.1 hypothetical protein FE781_08325 [Paenibacillus thermoaerophilus]